MKNVVLTKAGLTLKFDPRRWSEEGGSVDTIKTWVALAANYPDVKFWIASKNETFTSFEKKLFDMMFPLGNVEIMRGRHSTRRNSDAVVETHVNQLYDWVKSTGVVPDALIVDPGSYSRTNIPDTIPKKDGTGFAKPAMIAYAMSAPVINMINRLKAELPHLKWCTLHYDPKTDLKQADLLFDPDFSLSQMTHEYEAKRYRDGDWKVLKYRHEYEALATAIVVGSDVRDDDDFWNKRNVLLSAAINDTAGSNGTVSRWPEVKMILDSHPSSVVYGRWSEENVPEQDRFRFSDGRLPGPINKLVLDEKMREWKFTILSSSRRDWVTQKFWESLIEGVVPIFAPSYDTQRNIAWPDSMRMKSMDLKEVSKILDSYSDHSSWVRLAKAARNAHLTSAMRDGSELAHSIMRRFDLGCTIVRTGVAENLWNRIMAFIHEQESMNDFGDFL